MVGQTFRATMLAGLASVAVAGPAGAQQKPAATPAGRDATETRKLMLSGHGPEDAVPWDFTVSSGRRAGERATIPVPSNWQQQGFGTYQYGLQQTDRTKGVGTYRRTFTVPSGWKDQRIRLIFDGAMTDTRVTVNGVQAGPVHQGGYYRFGFDISKLVKVGETNTVEVEVAEASSNPDTERAERIADFWDFAGIFRPVWLEATPMQAIEHSAVDARANGDLSVDVALAAPRDVTRVEGQVTDAAGRPVGAPFTARIPGGGTGRVRLSTRIANPSLWSAERPTLYNLALTLYRGDQAVHRTRERFGFRTFEVRPGQGLYLNGQRVLLKGVNRHSFRPDTARTLTREDNYDDVRTIRAMNMNAVRMSHYPPDEAFLKAADELGLYVLDELSGWQHAHSTAIGRRLVREMVDRDVNHPSILFWDNGNEGGFNRELDGEFERYDPQNRPVLHPWELHDDVDTKHYPDYADLTRRLAGPNLVMPTEFMHALYDGGGGAGYDDYWGAIARSPRGAGGFIWAFADEGIARTDQGGAIDNYGTNAPDGIVGARHEKEASYYAVPDVLSPVQIATPRLDASFGGRLSVTNGYDFTSLDAVKFQWRTLRFARPGDASTAPRVLRQGQTTAAIAPHATSDLSLPLPADWRQADALSVTARKGEDELWTWVWPVEGVATPAGFGGTGRATTPSATRDGGTVRLVAGDVVARFDSRSGLLTDVTRGGRTLSVANGPRLVAIGPRSDEGRVWTELTRAGDLYRPAAPSLANLIEVKRKDNRHEGWVGFKLEVTADGTTWRTLYHDKRKPSDPDLFLLAPERIAAVRITNLTASESAPVSIASVRLGYEPKRFTLPATTAVAVTSGTEPDPVTGRQRAWLEADGAGGLQRSRWTLSADGSLALDYRYALSGPFLFHGVTFDEALGDVASVRGLVDGPRPAWQNRLRGNELGVHVLAAQGNASLPSPAQAGYYAGMRWARFNTSGGDWMVSSQAPTYLRVGTRMNDYPNTTGDFPEGDVSFLNAIPGMGSKFISAAASGPNGEAAVATGSYSGRLVFSFGTGRKAGRK